nr:PREDICTED: cysteine-rich receptor-like protein kinase 3 isoform X2 [Daucus carota subsp. sativus]
MTSYLLAMVSLTESVSMQSYGAAENGTVFAFADCRRDLSKNDCILCVEHCKVKLHSCLFFQSVFLGGRVYNNFDGCFLRYDGYRFFGEISDDEVFCAGNEFAGNKSLLRESVGELVRNLGVKGAKNEGFSVGNYNKGDFQVYGLVQCWRFLNKTDCEKCLEGLVAKVGSCLPKTEGSVLNSGCYVRYSTHKFYHNSRTTAASIQTKGGSKHLTLVLAGISAGIASLMLASTTYFFLKKHMEKQRREKEQYDYLASVTDSKLIFSYEMLEKATKYFHDSNKLGEGGSGHIYKGRLPDGRTVAIKRILFDTKQWAEHLFNEVNLISGINHKNHVKLLGYSVTGPESLLVYEYMPNQSLHDYFFGKKNVEALKWDVRYNILLGTAEGLMYLHEDSNLRIIHRDIKLSNILLDKEFTPKIADFGLARLFPHDKTHLSSAIAGTLGYMAPEYVFSGRLTEKADVYSFGVVVIEVVCGRQNYAFSESTIPLLEMVWNSYQKGKLCEEIDPVVKASFQEDAERVLKIGLLCAQASAELRPSMSKVVKMLMNNQQLPQPTQPPFISSRYVEKIPLKI